nr:MAG TPA: hypothetical protein [Caudoviricetes sp.]
MGFLLPKPVFKLLCGHARVKKIWLLVFAMHQRPPEKQKPRRVVGFH